MKEASLVLSVDIGSTAVKVIAMNENGEIAASASGHYPTDSPNPGWVEQDPACWWMAAAAAIRVCLEKIGSQAISGVSFSGHMSAPVLLGADGKPVMPAILIADARSCEETVWLRAEYRETFLRMTGNEPIDAFTVSKLLWIKNNRPEALRRAHTLLFPKDYVRYRMTGSLCSDPTDAGNSLLFDPLNGKWDLDLIDELGLPVHIFPLLQASSGLAGYVTGEAAAETGLPAGVPVVTGAADMACSQLGTGAVKPGTLAVTLSTSAQVVMRMDSMPPQAAGKMTVHPSAIPGTLYGMGSVFTGGLGVNWAYRLLSGKSRLEGADYEKLNELSEGMRDFAPGCSGLLFLPFLVGSGTPYFDASDRATWIGLTTGQSPEMLLHSVMEGIAYNIRESMEVLEEAGYAVTGVHLGGGGSRNPVWSAMIGDVLGHSIALLNNRDASAAGAAMLAGVGIGMFETEESASRKLVQTAEPIPHSVLRHQAYHRLYSRYRKAYKALNELYRDEVL